MAIYMYLADSSKKGSINLKNHNLSNSFLIGLTQALAIFPGISRSGVTISTCLVTGWERGDAAKFSFLLGLPAIDFLLNYFSTNGLKLFILYRVVFGVLILLNL